MPRGHLLKKQFTRHFLAKGREQAKARSLCWGLLFLDPVCKGFEVDRRFGYFPFRPLGSGPDPQLLGAPLLMYSYRGNVVDLYPRDRRHSTDLFAMIGDYANKHRSR
jgi:hypothetical protein